MKRIISLLTVILIVFSCCIPVCATDNIDYEIPYKDFFTEGKIEDLAPPVICIEDMNSYNTIILNTIVPQSITAIAKQLGPSFEYFYGVRTSTLSSGFQVDYKIPNGNWHYEESWDTFEYNNMSKEAAVYDVELDLENLENVFNIQLFSADTTNKNGDLSSLIINSNGEKLVDYTTVNFKIRNYVKCEFSDGTKKTFFSNWSDDITPQYINVDENYKLMTPQIVEMEAFPQDGLTSFNFIIKYDNETYEQLAVLRTLHDTHTDFVVEAYMIPKNENGSLKFEEATLLTRSPNSDDFATSMVCIYDEEVYDFSNWAFALKIKTKDGVFSSDFSPQHEIQSIETDEDADKKDDDGVYIELDPEIVDKCSLCNICSQPLGICVFAYVIFGVAILMIAVIVIFIMKKRSERM